MTSGGIGLRDILDMDIDDFADWAEAAIQYRRDMNKALAKAQKSRN